ncbi:hypothetical protein CLV92_11923 [Kineococcus xinjiangensis]|uniref:TrbC/VIRB2 family protein n=1 Tax=Kineococcus xinjiangensis TaxID=512762 RepID=A0A2S6ICJ2_9ACTN|nr:hypothetical protein [Kineococcus xinjiangensis]PPK91942.1 hypothetical protein CLV92_11923 [Kineococcus xinjiangensis]
MGLMSALAAVPQPGAGEAFPGSEGILTILNWSAWTAFAVCVFGVIIAGVMMAVARAGGGGSNEHTSRLAWVMGGCVVVGSAGALVGALV